MHTVARAEAHSDYCLHHLSDPELLASTRGQVGRSNQVLADLLAHLAEVEVRGLYRSRACSSLYTYCIYELRMSEDAALRRVHAARILRRFPVVYEHIAAGELHLTAVLMLGPHLTQANQVEVLARAKHRTKKEVQALVRQLDPLPDVPACIEPLGPLVSEAAWGAAPSNPSSGKWLASLCGPVRDLPPGERPRDWVEARTNDAFAVEPCKEQGAGGIPVQSSASEPCFGIKDAFAEQGAGDAFDVAMSNEVGERNFGVTEASAVEPCAEQGGGAFDFAKSSEQRRADFADAPDAPVGALDMPSGPLAPQRYKEQFTASQEYVDLLDEARDLLAHAVPSLG